MICRINHEYVGKKYKLTLPNGETFGRYKEQDDAIAKASTLIGANVCTRLELEVEKAEDK